MIQLRGHRNSPVRPTIKIVVDNPKAIYSNGDKVSGKIVVQTPCRIASHDISVRLLGESRSSVDRTPAYSRVALSADAKAFHQFLEIRQNDGEKFYSQRTALDAGEAYTLPFNFVIPARLSPRVCLHEVNDSTVRDAHLLLPPSMDAVSRASIKYCLHAKICQLESGICIPLAVSATSLQFIPKLEVVSQPPLKICSNHERSVRHGPLRTKAGTIGAQISRLPPFYSRASNTATISLRFDPFENGHYLPRLSHCTARIQSQTTHSNSACTFLPTGDSPSDFSSELSSRELKFAKLSLSEIHWVRHESDSPSRNLRDSPGHSSRSEQGGFYTAAIEVPLALPTDRDLTPTFHSCLISNTYVLKLRLHLAWMKGSIDLEAPVEMRYAGDQHSLCDFSESFGDDEKALLLVEEDEQLNITWPSNGLQT